jgi:hypothetical protein
MGRMALIAVLVGLGIAPVFRVWLDARRRNRRKVGTEQVTTSRLANRTYEVGAVSSLESSTVSPVSLVGIDDEETSGSAVEEAEDWL